MPFFTTALCFRARIPVSRVAARRFISDTAQRIYVASASANAQFIAHSLRDSPDPVPVTLIVNTQKKLRQWRSGRYIALHSEEYGDCVKHRLDLNHARSPFRKHGRIITKEEHEGEPIFKPHYDALAPGETQLDAPEPPTIHDNEPIQHLVIVEQPQYVVSQLLAVKHRLSTQSTVLIVCTVLGVMEEVLEKVFPIAEQRPKFMLGELTHAVRRPKRSLEHGHNVNFQIIHSRFGFLHLCRTPLFSGEEIPRIKLNEVQTPVASQTDYLMQTLQRAPRLAAIEMTPLALHMRQLDAVALRSVIRPMTALMDHENGALLFNHYLKRSMRLIIAETSLILRSLPELRGHPLAESRYGPDRIEKIIAGILRTYPHEHSTTLLDVRRGLRTDVDYVNGYLVRRGHELGLKAFMNFMMQELVRGKASMVAQENARALQDDFPDDDDLPATGEQAASHEEEDEDDEDLVKYI